MMDLGNIIVTPAGADNPYRAGISGAERSAALGKFLRGIDAPGFDFWDAPACGGARKLESGAGLVRADVVEFYWNEDGTPKAVRHE